MQNGNLQNIDFKPFSKISRLFWFVYSDVRDLISKENQIMKKRGEMPSQLKNTHFPISRNSIADVPKPKSINHTTIHLAGPSNETLSGCVFCVPWSQEAEYQCQIEDKYWAFIRIRSLKSNLRNWSTAHLSICFCNVAIRWDGAHSFAHNHHFLSKL